VLVSRKYVKDYAGWTDCTYDEKIDELIPVIQDRIALISNNYFVIDKNLFEKLWDSGTAYTFAASDNSISNTCSTFVTSGFAAGDNIFVSGSFKNDGYYEISSLTETKMILTSANTIVDEALDRYVHILYVKWPKALKQIACDMIKFDITIRGKTTGVKSESIGDYSVTYDKEKGSLHKFGYPPDVIDGLDIVTSMRFI